MTPITAFDILAVIGLIWCLDRLVSAIREWREIRRRMRVIERFDQSKWEAKS